MEKKGREGRGGPSNANSWIRPWYVYNTRLHFLDWGEG